VHSQTMIENVLQDPAKLEIYSLAVVHWLDSANAIAVGFAIVALNAVAWAGNLIALPGNWVMVLILACFAWLGPQDGRVEIGLSTVILATLFAIAGEAIEFAASALGARRAGASRRSTLYAVLGSFAGALAGAVIGIPIPIIGPIVAAVLFAGLGAMGGAIYGERTEGRNWKETWSIGHAAFWGRTFGTFGKITAGFAILMLTAVSVAI